jgi:hypothetical protein
MDEKEGRDERGRFRPGWRGGPGRPAGQTISAELRRQADPEAIAARLLAMIDDPRTGAREKLGAIAQVIDRLEGRAVSRSINLHATAARALPVGFDTLPAAQRHQVLIDLRRRALQGALPEESEADHAAEE